MTLHDLWKLIRRFARKIAIVSVACALICGVAVLILPSSYQATAVVSVTGEAGATGGIAETQAASASSNGTKVTAEADTAAKRISLVATAGSAETAIQAANDAANATSSAASSTFSQQKFNVSEASSAKSLSQNPIKIAVVALFGALFVAICCVVAWDMVRRPIKSKEDAAQAANAPVFGEVPAHDHGERLLANIRFASPEMLDSLCIIPVGTVSTGVVVANELLSAAQAAGVRATAMRADPHAEYFNPAAVQAGMAILVCAPLSEGMGAAYLSRAADVTVLAVREWTDSAVQVESVLEELELADVRLDGVVLLPESTVGVEGARGGRFGGFGQGGKEPHGLGGRGRGAQSFDLPRGAQSRGANRHGRHGS